MIQFTLIHPQATRESLGFLPEFFSENDPRPAREQINEAYAHGGGWDPFPGFTLGPKGQLFYPGDPPMQVIAEAKLRDEVIRLHTYEWVSIVQPDGSFEVCRCD
jgi:hypothetical protein